MILRWASPLILILMLGFHTPSTHAQEPTTIDQEFSAEMGKISRSADTGVDVPGVDCEVMFFPAHLSLPVFAQELSNARAGGRPNPFPGSSTIAGITRCFFNPPAQSHGETKTVQFITRKGYNDLQAQIDTLRQVVSKSVSCTNETYSKSCKSWPQDTIAEMRKAGDYQMLATELLKDPAFVQAVAEAMKAQKK